MDGYAVVGGVDGKAVVGVDVGFLDGEDDGLSDGAGVG